MCLNLLHWKHILSLQIGPVTFLRQRCSSLARVWRPSFNRLTLQGWPGSFNGCLTLSTSLGQSIVISQLYGLLERLRLPFFKLDPQVLWNPTKKLIQYYARGIFWSSIQWSKWSLRQSPQFWKDSSGDFQSVRNHRWCVSSLTYIVTMKMAFFTSPYEAFLSLFSPAYAARAFPGKRPANWVTQTSSGRLLPCNPLKRGQEVHQVVVGTQPL